jgi:hypothetical protein
MFTDAKEKSLKIGEYYSNAAHECGCYFLDAGKFVSSSEIDGVHLEKKEHEILGKEVAKKVLEILGPED